MVGLSFASQQVFAKNLTDVMANMEKGITTLKDVQGVQTLKFMVENELVTANNTFKAKSPDKFWSETRIPVAGSRKVQKVLTVCDGKNVWQYIPGPEDKKVIKMNLSAAAGQLDAYQKKFMASGYGIVGSEGLLKLANADYDLKVAGAAKIKGMDMDVLEGTLKGTAKPGSWTLPTPARIKYSVGAKDGFIYKMEGFNKAGKLVLEISHENLKFNAGIPDKVFAFTPPKGVEVFEATEVAPHVVK